MTTLSNSTLDSAGNVLITGTSSITLNDSYRVSDTITGTASIQFQNSQSTDVTSFYYVNGYINEYLVGKGLTSTLQDYRGYYFEKSFDLMMEKDLIPDWYLIYFYYPPV